MRDGEGEGEGGIWWSRKGLNFCNKDRGYPGTTVKENQVDETGAESCKSCYDAEDCF